MMETTKRRFSRIALKIPATLVIDETGEYEVRELTNLSIGGCLVPLEHDIEEGAECSISIRLSAGVGSTPIEITGEVVRYDKVYAAIRFTGIAPEDLNHLHNLIRYNAPDPDRIDEEIKQHPGLV